MPIQHPEDVILVRNINVDDPDFTKFFEVRWNGIVFRIPPGDIRRMPRYLAYHFNKHLTDRIIFRMDMAQYGRKIKTSRLRDQKLRDELQRKILVAVDQYYMSDETDPQQQLMKLYGQLNPDDVKNSMSVGNVDLPLEPPALSTLKVDNLGNPVLGDLDSIANDQVGVGQEELSKIPTKRSRKELLAEAEELGIELDGKESDEEVLAQIQAF